MEEIKATSIRTIIMSMLKTNISKDYPWNYLEVQLAVFCSELPELTSEHKKNIFIDKLREIKQYLIDKQIPSERLRFLDDEIDRYENTKQICLYIEEDEELDKDIIDKYARLSIGSEGVIGIHHPYNYSQLRKLTNGVFNKTGLIRFYISKEKVIYGKIIAEIYDRPQKIPIATLLESKKINKDTEMPEYKKINLFGDYVDKKTCKKIKEIEIPFYVYRFISEYNQEFILFSTESRDIGNYIIDGVTTQCDDYKMLTESAKLPTKLPFFFANTIENRILQYDSHKEFIERIDFLGITKQKTFDYPFSWYNPKTKATYLLNQPKWFKWLIWSWLCHASKGLCQNYPMHLFIVGIPGSGKSMLINALHAHSGEQKLIFSGVGSTYKYLIPSFKSKPAQLGYLAESTKFGYCDEFLRCFVRSKADSGEDESIAFLNDLLEHQRRECGSGVSKVTVKMTSRIIFTTNPLRGAKTMSDLLHNYDNSFLSRNMVYYQSKEHTQLVKKSSDHGLEIYPYKIDLHDWMSIIDYLQSFDAKYDINIVNKIYSDTAEILSEKLLAHYDARHSHHLECLIDGIIKARCFLDKDISFAAIPEDYEILKEIWSHIIRSWVNIEEIKKLHIKDRIHYLSTHCQSLYWEFNDLTGLITKQRAEKLGLDLMTKDQYVESLIVLREMGLIIEHNEEIRLYAPKEYYGDDSE